MKKERAKKKKQENRHPGAPLDSSGANIKTNAGIVRLRVNSVGEATIDFRETKNKGLAVVRVILPNNVSLSLGPAPAIIDLADTRTGEVLRAVDIASDSGPVSIEPVASNRLLLLCPTTFRETDKDEVAGEWKPPIEPVDPNVDKDSEFAAERKVKLKKRKRPKLKKRKVKNV